MGRYASIWAEGDEPEMFHVKQPARKQTDPRAMYREAQAAGLGEAFLPPPPDEEP